MISHKSHFLVAEMNKVEGGYQSLFPPLLRTAKVQCVGNAVQHRFEDCEMEGPRTPGASLLDGAMLKTHIRLIFFLLVGCSGMYQVGD
jgi:hypothetical protein